MWIFFLVTFGVVTRPRVGKVDDANEGWMVWSMIIRYTRSTYRIVGAGWHWMEEKHDTLQQALLFTIHIH
jgi:hypothetical protein